MKIGENYFESIIITNSEGEPIAIITDDQIVEKEGYKVIVEPTK